MSAATPATGTSRDPARSAGVPKPRIFHVFPRRGPDDDGVFRALCGTQWSATRRTVYIDTAAAATRPVVKCAPCFELKAIYEGVDQ